MKRLSRVFLPLFFLAISLASCEEEFSRDARVPGAKVHRTLSTSVESSPLSTTATRVGLGKGLTPVWDADDSLSVFDDEGNNPFIVSATDGSSARFGGEVSESATTLSALYPYNATASQSGNLIFTTLPAVQTVTDSVCHEALLCTAQGLAEDGLLNFRNAYSLLKVNISLPGVSSVVLRGRNSELLAGEGSVNLEGDRSFIPGEGSSQSITLLPAGSSFTKGANYYIVLAPVEFTQGFEVVMNRIDGADAVRSTDKVLSIERNTGVNLADVATTLTWSNLITTKEELFAWNEGYAAWTASDEVKLGADIDMEGEAWTPHTFRGTFDGQSHRLYNFVCESNVHGSGFFSDLYGTVQNLVLGSSDGETWDNTSIVKHEYSGSQTAWPNAGSVCARMFAGAYIYNVSNFATVELGADDSKGRCRLGGIAAYVGEAGRGIENCTNYGTVVNNCASSTAGNQMIGGILGSPETAVTLKNCTNRGNITSNCPGACWIGGIMGTSNGRAATDQSSATEYVASLTNCKNYGTVRGSAANSDLYMGGIVGFLTGAEILWCENHGSVASSVSDKANHIGGIAGGFHKKNASYIDDCQNDGEIIGGATTASNNIGGLVGYVSSAAGAELTLSAVSNTGKVHCCGSSSQSAVGGLIGRSEKAGCDIIEGTNEGEIYVDGTVGGGQRNIGGICGVTTNGSTYDGCVNSGDIHNASKYAKACVGGFFGHGAAFTVNCNSRQSVNSGKVYGYSATNDGAFGGISGNGVVSFTIQGTESRPVLNSGAVNSDDATTRTWVGGFVGYIYSGTNTITYAHNTGKVSKNNTNNIHGVLGGICGRVQASNTTLSHCTNDGTIQDEGQGENYRWAGGIVGRALNTSGSASVTISDCINNGTVSLRSTGSKKTNGLAAGGILGSGNRSCTLTGNTNNGNVSISATQAAAHPHAGGIIGDDVDVDASTTAPLANTITGNTNTGTITATGAASQARIGAGNIIGRMSASAGVSTVSGNNCRGSVAATAGGTTLFNTSATGGSGAVVGDMQTEAANTITAAVSRSITVGNVSYETAAGISALTAWLCPNSTKIEATYTD